MMPWSNSRHAMTTAGARGRVTRRLVAAFAALTAAAPLGAAAAGGGNAARAEALFRDARALSRAGKHEAACSKLAESQRLDPAIGTQFRLAECYEKIGRRALAWRLFNEVAEAAKRSGRRDREEQARELADALRARVALIAIHVAAGAASAAGFQVVLDGASLPAAEWDRPIAVEPGEHVVSATAAGRAPWSHAILAREGATFAIDIPVLAEAPNVVEPRVVPPPARSGAKTIVLGAGAALTAVSLGGAIAFTLVSNARASEADELRKHYKKDSDCWNSTDSKCKTLLAVNGASDTFHDAAIAGYVAAGILGGATLAYWLWPRVRPADSSSAIVPWMGHHTAGMSFHGSF